jgi:hypothetical protein
MIEKDPNFIVPVQLPLEFWLALQTVRNHVYGRSQDYYFSEALRPPRGGFHQSINVVDTYLHKFHWWVEDQG